MTVLLPQKTPLQAEPTELTQPFWDGCGKGVLLFQRCDVCKEANFEPTEWCRFCLSTELEWEKSRGRGVIATWTVVWRPVVPTYAVPYAPAIIELDEGFHMMTAVVDCDHSELRTGLRVVVAFHPGCDAFVLPYFTLERLP